MKTIKLGRGKNYSVAKAALLVYYSNTHRKERAVDMNDNEYFFDHGDTFAMHEIVDVAGANHCSFFTPALVSGRLANSPYWNAVFVPGFYSGMRGHGGANTYTPSEKGKEYYNKYLKHKQKEIDDFIKQEYEYNV